MMVNRNIYDYDVDFAALAFQFPEFKKLLKSNGQLDFSDPLAVKQLTRCLLERDFGLVVQLPDDRLCPPVPNRFNYIVWIQDLIDTTCLSYSEGYNEDRDVIGLDVGTGASCIYPLLGCKARLKWRFGATDIDERNLTLAKQNIVRNDLKARIRPLQTSPHDALFPLDRLGLEKIDFTMCNPPFYSSNADLLASAASKSKPPHSACTGAEVEMVTPGGEVAFVTRMIEESKSLKDKCQWFSSMLGKYSSVEVIINTLKEEGADNWAVKDLVQGNKTRRWAVGWSWSSRRPNQSTARGTSTLPKHLLPFPPEYTINLPEAKLDVYSDKLNEIMSSLSLQWQYRPAISTGVGFAKGNVWSRAARRSKGTEETSTPEEPALAFKVRLETASPTVNLWIRWLQGTDSVLFESLCGMLKRKMTV